MTSLTKILLAAALLGACGDAAIVGLSTGAESAVAATGTWKQQSRIPGSALELTLAPSRARDSALVGTGAYAIEAGRSGTLTVTGIATHGAVHLDLAYDYGVEAHVDAAFDGSLSTLTGGIKFGPAAGAQPTSAITFARVR